MVISVPFLTVSSTFQPENWHLGALKRKKRTKQNSQEWGVWWNLLKSFRSAPCNWSKRWTKEVFEKAGHHLAWCLCDKNQFLTFVFLLFLVYILLWLTLNYKEKSQLWYYTPIHCTAQSSFSVMSPHHCPYPRVDGKSQRWVLFFQCVLVTLMSKGRSLEEQLP